MKLIDNASNWYKMHSMRAIAAVALVQGVLLVTPADWASAHILSMFKFTWQDLANVCTMVLAFLGGLGRLVQQDNV